MAENTIFDSSRLMTEYVGTMSRKELIEFFNKLCARIESEADSNGFRGGVRPNNISISENGEVALGEGGMPERNKWTAEQLEFISPEEFWNGEASSRSDVYSLGLLLYYCITDGKLPFQPTKKVLTAEDRAKTVRRRMGGEPIKAPEGAGRSLGAIIEKSLSFRPEERYLSVSDMPVVLNLCLKELESDKSSNTVKMPENSEEELTDVEKMMIGLISKAAEEAALSDSEEKTTKVIEESVAEVTGENVSEEPASVPEEPADKKEETPVSEKAEETPAAEEGEKPAEEKASTEEPKDTASGEEPKAEESKPEEKAPVSTEEKDKKPESRRKQKKTKRNAKEAASEEKKAGESADRKTETAEPATVSEKPEAEKPETSDKAPETGKDPKEAVSEPKGTDQDSKESVKDPKETAPKDQNSEKTTKAAAAAAGAAGAAAAAKAAKNKKKQAASTATPAVQYNTTGTAAQKSQKYKKKKKKKKAGLVVLLLCALMIAAAFIINEFVNGGSWKELLQTAKSPEETQEVVESVTDDTVVAEVPETAMPEPTEEEPSEPVVYKEDISWTAAESKCEAMGGHLAVIRSQEDLDAVIQMAIENDLRFVWVGCQRLADGTMRWVDGSTDINFYVWGDGEPSLIGSGGEAEDYIILYNTQKDLSGQWVYNDVGNNPAADYAAAYSGKIGYICEYDN